MTYAEASRLFHQDDSAAVKTSVEAARNSPDRGKWNGVCRVLRADGGFLAPGPGRAANRARGVIEQYDGAPSTDEALSIIASAYRKLGIEDLATTVDTVHAQNRLPDDPVSQKGDKPWWRFW
jgi:hypothetical protein